MNLIIKYIRHFTWLAIIGALASGVMMVARSEFPIELLALPAVFMAGFLFRWEAEYLLGLKRREYNAVIKDFIDHLERKRKEAELRRRISDN